MGIINRGGGAEALPGSYAASGAAMPPVLGPAPALLLSRCLPATPHAPHGGGGNSGGGAAAAALAVGADPERSDSCGNRNPHGGGGGGGSSYTVSSGGRMGSATVAGGGPSGSCTPRSRAEAVVAGAGAVAPPASLKKRLRDEGAAPALEHFTSPHASKTPRLGDSLGGTSTDMRMSFCAV